MNRIDACKLFHEGAIALAEMEANGMRLDVPYLKRTMAELAERIKHLESKLRGCEEYALQRRRYGQRCNLMSDDQLGAVLFEDLGFKALAHTATGRPQLNDVMLEHLNTKYTRGYLKLKKLDKLHGTFLKGILEECEGEFVHGFFGLGTTRTYRSSSNSPNLQNIPIRDAELGPMMRRVFIPRPRCRIVETDYTGAEVRVACSLSGDQKLTYDTLQGDMHRDMACELFFLEKEQVAKPTRQTAKNGFTFAEFYGDWYKQVCKNLWDQMDRFKLALPDGTRLRDHLAKHRITERGECDAQKDTRQGTFEAHVRAVEDRFWNKRFKVYHAKRRAWIEEYSRKGYVDLVTGFRCNGPMTKNQVLNYHVQGPSFHCLLWTLTRVNEQIRKRKMKTKLICQIHDSLLADVPFEEQDDYIELTKETATTKLQKAWPWVVVPMDMEIEAAETNWAEKKKVEVSK